MGGPRLETRCPRLGHEVPIAYCYNQPEGMPCGRMLSCWEWRLPNLRQALERLLPREKWEQYLSLQAKPRHVALVQEIERAKLSRHRGAEEEEKTGENAHGSEREAGTPGE